MLDNRTEIESHILTGSKVRDLAAARLLEKPARRDASRFLHAVGVEDAVGLRCCDLGLSSGGRETAAALEGFRKLIEFESQQASAERDEDESVSELSAHLPFLSVSINDTR